MDKPLTVEITGQALVEELMSITGWNETKARKKARQMVRLVAHGDRARTYIAERDAKREE
jgi:hypothetical protein